MKNIIIEIELANLTQTSIARKTGINQATLSKIFNGVRQINDDQAHAILTKALDYKDSEALAMIAKWKMQELAKNAGIELPEGSIPLTDNFEYVPLVSEVSCGEGMEIESIMSRSDYEALVPVPKEYIKQLDKTFAFTAKGNSMATEIQDGDTVVVQQSKDYIPGKVYLYKLGNDFGLARLKKETNGDVIIVKANHQYPPIQVGQRDIEICGVVQVVLNLRIY